MSTQPSLLANKVAIITGGGNGIGKSIAEVFLKHGAKVAFLDVEETAVLQTKGELKSINPGTHSVYSQTLDVSDHKEFQRFTAGVVATFGRLDILVNNAAIEAPAPLFDYPLNRWNRIMEVNLTSYFSCARTAAEKMRAGGAGGKIINISSIQSQRSEAGSVAYAVSKAAIDQLTRSLAIELAPLNINVNSVRPGFIKTRMSLRPDGSDETETDEFKEYYVKKRKIALARAGHPQEVANAVLFLASDLSSYITGASLAIDGGLSTTL